MIKNKFVLENRAGLHSRPATLIAKTAMKFKSDISLEVNGKIVNAKSVLNILTLGAPYKTEIFLTADGEDEENAYGAIAELIKNKFNEE